MNMISIKVMSDAGEEILYMSPCSIIGYKSQGEDTVIFTGLGNFILAKSESVDTIFAQKELDSAQQENHMIELITTQNEKLFNKVQLFHLSRIEDRLKKLEEASHDDVAGASRKSIA